MNLAAAPGALDSAEALARAGAWLGRLAAPDDPRLKARMARRWDEACAVATVEPDVLARIRANCLEAVGA